MLTKHYYEVQSYKTHPLPLFSVLCLYPKSYKGKNNVIREGKSNSYEGLQIVKGRGGKRRARRRTFNAETAQKLQKGKPDPGGKWLRNYRKEAFIRLKSR